MVRRILRALDARETNSKNLRQSANKLEETPCVFFVTIVLKHVIILPLLSSIVLQLV